MLRVLGQFFRIPGALFLAACALTALVYWPGLAGGFMFDDFPNIVLNDAFRTSEFSLRTFAEAAISSPAGPLARPIAMASFAVQIAAFGLDPYPLKLVNLAIHLINGVLVYLLCVGILRALEVRLTAGVPLSARTAFPAVVAAAWLLAPINLTSVLYVVQRMESLSGTFVLAGLLTYLHGRMRYDADSPAGLAWMVGGLLGGTLLATLAKETGVMLPAYAFVLEWVLFGLHGPVGRRIDTRLLALFSGVLFLPGLLGIIVTVPTALSGASYSQRNFGVAERLLTEARVVVDYLHWIVVPRLELFGLHHDDYPISSGWWSPAGTMLSVLLLVGLFAAALWLKARRPLVSLGILLFFVGHSLVSSYLPLELVYEHRNYLPSFGVLFALLALLLLEPRGGSLRMAGGVLAAGLIGFAGFVTFLRAEEWSNPGRLTYIEATRHPGSERANYELGRFLLSRTTDPNGLGFSLAVKSFQAAADLPGSGLLPLHGLALAYAKHSMPVRPEIWARMERVVARGPMARQDITALHALIVCRSKGNCNFEWEHLGNLLTLAVESSPHAAILHTLRANFALNIAHDYALALREMQLAVALAPKDATYWENLIGLQTSLGRFDEARAGVTRLRDLDRFGTLEPVITRLDFAISDKRDGKVTAKGPTS